MTDKLLGIIYGAFIGDALALGPHWIYDIEEIRRLYKPITGYSNPEHTPYHKAKVAGDFTHYGDQSLVLLKSIADEKDFSISNFKKQWIALIKTGDLYLDHATKESLSLLTHGNTGSSSDELGGFARSGPMFLLHDMSEEDFERTMLKQVHMTHNNELLSVITIFFTRVLQDILAGLSIEESLERHSNIHPFIYDAYENALSNHTDIVNGIKAIGQSCSSKLGLPGILTVLLREQDLKTALIENCYAGGDSASRAMILGMIYGARDGFDQLPKKWLNDLNHLSSIQTYIKKFSD